MMMMMNIGDDDEDEDDVGQEDGRIHLSGGNRARRRRVDYHVGRDR